MATASQGRVKELVKRGKDADVLSMQLVELAAGEATVVDNGEEVLVITIDGDVDASFGASVLGRAGGRKDVFSAAGTAVYAPPGKALELRAAGGPATIIISTAPLDGAQPAQARLIPPDAQAYKTVGTGNWQRNIRTILGPEHQAGRIIAGETINPPGNWSSYPPHKHDSHRPPQEVQLEEVYFYKCDPKEGFGVQLNYDDAQKEEVSVVRDNDVAVIRTGYHPVVAAPGYSLYYYWVMAGQGRVMIPYFDPKHAWVQK